MSLLNVSFGILAFMPQGWLFMAVFILIECIGLSFLLTKKINNKVISVTVILSNIISGIMGIVISMIINGGWWLVVWLPWVSQNEVDLNNGLINFIIYYLCAFVLTLIIESIFNVVLLNQRYKKPKVLIFTLLINFITYLIGSFVMYSFSFSKFTKF